MPEVNEGKQVDDREWVNQSLRLALQGIQDSATKPLHVEIERLRRAIDDHHDQDCRQMCGPYGEQWREPSKPCTCWVGDVLRGEYP